MNASAQEFDEALMNVSKEMQRLLMRITGWDAVGYVYVHVGAKRRGVEAEACKPCEVQLSLRMGTPKLPPVPAARAAAVARALVLRTQRSPGSL